MGLRPLVGMRHRRPARFSSVSLATKPPRRSTPSASTSSCAASVTRTQPSPSPPKATPGTTPTFSRPAREREAPRVQTRWADVHHDEKGTARQVVTAAELVKLSCDLVPPRSICTHHLAHAVRGPRKAPRAACCEIVDAEETTGSGEGPMWRANPARELRSQRADPVIA